MSNVFTSTAAPRPSFRATIPLDVMLGPTTSKFGFLFPGVGGVASTNPVHVRVPTSTNTTITITTTIAGTATATHEFSFNQQSLTSSGINNTAPVSGIQTPVKTYGQLGRLVNKRSLESQNEEKDFFQETFLQVNDLECALIEDSEKINILHGRIEKAKNHQKRLQQELEFVLSQQAKLKDLLTSLEGPVEDPSGSVNPQHGDEEFEKT